MADEQDNDQTPENVGDQAAKAAVTEGAEPAAAASTSDAEAAAVEVPEPEPEPKPEVEAEEAPAEAAQITAVPAEPVEQVSSKERRRKARSTHSGEARPTRSPEDRHAERVAERRAKAVRRRSRRLQERTKRSAKRESASATPVEQLAPVHAPVEGRRAIRQGLVVSDKADKTITVRIDFARRHRRYEKIVRSSSTLHAHDENNEAHEGDVVRVIESRPLSKSKRWKLVDVLERAR
jgi:small subunit ribosomal protein S17